VTVGMKYMRFEYQGKEVEQLVVDQLDKCRHFTSNV